MTRLAPALAATLIGLGGCSSDSNDTDGDATGADSGASSGGATTTTTAGGSSGGGTTTTAGGETGNVLPPGTTALELRIDQFEILPQETDYVCFEWTFSLTELAHIVGFTPVIDNAQYVHHYVLTMIDTPRGDNGRSSCFEIDGDLAWAWAPGVQQYVLPEEAGFLVGDAPGGDVTFRLQVHYNNPLLDAGAIDSSGLDVLVTNQLRPNNAGAFVVADVQGISIPPGMAAYEHVTTCSGLATSAILDHPITVFGSSMHAHDIGSVLWTDIERGGQVVHELNRDDPYRFDEQHVKIIDNYEIMPGDAIVNHCIYDSTSRTQVTQGGPGTADEMCWNTMLYYPKTGTGIDFCSGAF